MTGLIDIEKLKRDAHGKWPKMLERLGVDKRYLTNRHGPCPMCNDGRNRYRFDDQGDGRWFCNQCPPPHSGDGFSLLMGVKGWTFIQAAREVQQIVGTAPATRFSTGRDPEVVRAEVKEILKLSRPIEAVEATRLWWMRRIGRVPAHRDLRAREALLYPGHGHHPAMVAVIRKVDGAGASLHRTYLTAEGDKAGVPEVRRVMDALEMPKGCAIRLGEPVDGVLGIAEGIETAGAATELFGVPCWAAVNAGMLESWQPPPGVRVIVFGDNDPNFHGQKVAYELANRLQRQREKVPVDDVKIPDVRGEDWNDVWLRTMQRSAAA